MEYAEQAMALLEGFIALEEFRVTGSREGFRAWSEKYSGKIETVIEKEGGDGNLGGDRGGEAGWKGVREVVAEREGDDSV